MPRVTPRDLLFCRNELYDQCQGLASTLEVDLADFAERVGIATDRELALIRNGEPCIPISSIPRLAILMMRLQDEVNATYFRHLRDVWATDGVQGELFASLSDDDDLPF